jgi:hypothetical protein
LVIPDLIRACTKVMPIVTLRRHTPYGMLLIKRNSDEKKGNDCSHTRKFCVFTLHSSQLIMDSVNSFHVKLCQRIVEEWKDRKVPLDPKLEIILMTSEYGMSYYWIHLRIIWGLSTVKHFISKITASQMLVKREWVFGLTTVFFKKLEPVFWSC